MQNQALQATKTSYRNAISVAAAILFAVGALYSLFSVAVQLINLVTILRLVSAVIPRSDLIRILTTSSCSILLTLVGVAIHTLLLFALLSARKNRFLVTCVSGDAFLQIVSLMTLVVTLIIGLITGNSPSFELLLSVVSGILSATGAILLFTVVLFHCTPKFANAKKWTRIACVVPAILFAICALLGWVQSFLSMTNPAFGTDSEAVLRIVAWLVKLPLSMAFPTAVLLLGIWVTFSTPHVKKAETDISPCNKSTTAPQHTQQERQAVQQHHQKADTVSIGTADELRKYKELLDAGAITREEYEAVKARLLNI